MEEIFSGKWMFFDLLLKQTKEREGIKALHYNKKLQICELQKVPLGDLGGLYLQPYSFTMACKFRCIHTLDSGDAIAEITGNCYKHGVFKYITAFWQLSKKEISTGIFGSFVIA